MPISQLVVTILICAFIQLAAARRILAPSGQFASHFYFRGKSATTLSSGQKHRRLPHPKHHHGHGSSYVGCLNYTNDELSSKWKFSGSYPSCSYVSRNGDDDDEQTDDDAGNGDDDVDRKSGQNSLYSYDDDDDDDDDHDSNGGEASGGLWGQVSNWTGWKGWSGWPGNGNDGRNGGGNSAEGDRQDEGYVVTNEDIVGGNDNGNENPMDSFDITQCDTYANLWVWDLSLSCDSSASLENCECTFTEELMAETMIICDDINECPVECPVCATCFKLVGCEPDPTSFRTKGISSSTILAICAAGGLFLFAILYYVIRRRHINDENSLGARLLGIGDQDLTQQKGISHDKLTGSREPESILRPYPSIPNFESDLSSLESYTFESDHTPSTPETLGRKVKNIETASAPSIPKSEAGDEPVVDSSVVAGNESATPDEVKPKATVLAMSFAPTSSPAALTLASTSAVAPVSPETNTIARKAPISPNVSGKRAIAALPIISIEPITTALVSTSPQIKTRAMTSSMTPKFAQSMNLDVPTAVRLGQSVRHAKAVNASANGDCLEIDSSLKDTPSATTSSPLDTIKKVETLAKVAAASTLGVTVGTETNQHHDELLELVGSPTVTNASLKHSTVPKLPEMIPPNTSGDTALHQTTQAEAVGSNIAQGIESTTEGSPLSHREKREDDGSECPWIGDVDLSFEPASFDDNDNTEKRKAAAAANDVSPKAECSTHKKATTDVPPREPPSVWLVPLDDLEGAAEEPKPPVLDANEELAETPSVVWLVPSTSQAELAEENKEGDSASESSWSPEEQSGPWLAPI